MTQRILHRSQHAQVVGEMWLLQRTKSKKLLILGGSSARDAFRPKNLACFFPEYEIHNLALTAGSSHVLTEHRQILEDALQLIPEEIFFETKIIYAISPTLFLPRGNRTDLTQYQQAELRMYSFLYRLENGVLKANYSVGTTAFFKQISRPFFGLDNLFHMIKDNGVVELFRDDYWHPTDVMSTRYNSHEEFEENSNLFISLTEESDISEEEMLKSFENMLTVAKYNNLDFTLVFLPWPEWAREHITFYDTLKRDIEKSVMLYAYPRLKYVDLSEALPENLFYDLNHVAPDGAEKCAYYLWTNLKE